MMMFGVIDELRTRLQEIDERQARTEQIAKDTCNNVAELQKSIHETQEQIIKAMKTLRQVFEQIKDVCIYFNQNCKDIKEDIGDIEVSTPWV